MASLRRLSEGARRLDNLVLGGAPVKDDRPLRERLLRPRPAVWSRRGRISSGLIVLAMLAAIFWLPQPFSIIAVVILLAAAFVVVATDERRRPRGTGRPEGK